MPHGRQCASHIYPSDTLGKNLPKLLYPRRPSTRALTPGICNSKFYMEHQSHSFARNGPSRISPATPCVLVGVLARPSGHIFTWLMPQASRLVTAYAPTRSPGVLPSRSHAPMDPGQSSRQLSAPISARSKRFLLSSCSVLQQQYQNIYQVQYYRGTVVF